nr:hypothetical protein B0A51_13018 [Rachicladosporium sp. CCFEE 5018]
MAPSTFASAAAGNDMNGHGDNARRPNGTQTFRRTSIANTPSESQPARYVPPHRNGGATYEGRYGKASLLGLYQAQKSAGDEDISSLYIGGSTEVSNGATTWGRNDHTSTAPPNLDACLQRDAAPGALGLIDMDEAEKELFTTSVNTPLKPPSQNKENQPPNGRKISISHNVSTPGGFALPSPSASRVPGRRRETGDSYPFPDSATKDRPASPPPSLLRRRTDIFDKGDTRDDASDSKAATTPFSGMKRQSTGPLSAGFGAAPSPWSNTPQSAGFAPMGSFGNFGMGGSGSQGTPTEKRAKESRFKGLLSKESNEDIGGRSLDRKQSISGLSRVNEKESWRPTERAEPVPASLDEVGEEDASGPSYGLRGLDTPSRPNNRDASGFGAFGMTSDSAGLGQGFGQNPQQTPGLQRGFGGTNEPMSPTDTNPFKSPEQQPIDREFNGNDIGGGVNLAGLGNFSHDAPQQGGFGGLGGLPNLGRGIGSQALGSDRSQTGSAGPGRAFPSLGGLGNLGMPSGSAWPVGQGGLGTPGRQAAGMPHAFGGGAFGNPLGEVQSPSLAGLGAGGFGSSRMFAPNPQDQSRQGLERDPGTERLGQPQFGGLGGFGAFGDSDHPSQSHQVGGLSMDGPNDRADDFGTGLDPPHLQSTQPPGSSASNQPPAPQQLRQMVMPDRMRWIYRDPQGQTQGPWSGLEMHDWYKAGFFSPELLVKKAEDGEYEPLAQLIRRIGNSREPFLVPQIGITHGASTAPNAWAAGIPPGPASSAGAQPPFASSFPSFGTTLTADQQNALERRKQEEQYLMARQKEHLAQAQIASRIGHTPGGFSGFGPGNQPGQLNHHSSAQSLHSQASFGSITSPNAFQSAPGAAPTGQQPGFFDNSFRGAQSGLGAVGSGVDALGQIREEELPSNMDRLNLGSRAPQGGHFGAPGQSLPQQSQEPSQDPHSQQVQQMLQDRARLAEEQSRADALDTSTAPSSDRLQQFQSLQGQIEPRFQPAGGKTQAAIQPPQGLNDDLSAGQTRAQEPLSLTQQVQKAVSAKQSPAPAPHAWGKVEPGQAFPPAPSQSPLPAPAAQKSGRQSVAEQLHLESSSRSETPSTDTASIAVAPWAKEPAEGSKGPSLKEIQEAEAKKAAEQEVIAAAARRILQQREMEAQAALNVSTAPVLPGLPSSSKWGAPAASPATPTTGATPWAKAAQPKPTLTSAKSMAQIQKEEEARKKRVAAAVATAAASAMGGVPTPAGGKSYANLASKTGPPAAVPAGPAGAWTTIGAGGAKAKGPASPAPVPGARVASLGAVPQVAAKPVPSRQSTLNGPATVNAQAEFKKWAVGELRSKLYEGISAEDFVSNLLSFPLEPQILTEAVHASSSTIDSRHFATEYLRRKKLADKGLVDHTAPTKAGSPANAGQAGWSEVAKKGPGKEEAAVAGNGVGKGEFRVVPGKGKRSGGGKK